MKDFWKMIIAMMILNLVVSLLSPILAIFIQGIGEKSVITVGYAFGVFYITDAVASIYFGKLADKHGRKKFLILGNLIYSIVPFAFIFVSNVYQLIFLQFIEGIGIGMNLPSYYAIFSGKMKKHERGFGFGIFNSTASLVAGIGALVGASIAQFLGFRTLFVAMGIMQLVQTAIIATIKEK